MKFCALPDYARGPRGYGGDRDVGVGELKSAGPRPIGFSLSRSPLKNPT
jgi:hypothetical protein